MNDSIQLLPDHVANQIAAGEVVQRPSSVVKELLENAIDAEAKHIQLIIKDAGRSLIQVVDDGLGMSVTDLRMAFERHATSKIRTTDDIFSIRTKGFRGEALASISAVAQVETKTKREQDEIGSLLIIESGEVRTQDVIVAPKGTSIAVKNLFYSVPARRNFLKSNSIELKHIQDEFIRVALAHENIEFTFYNNDSLLYKLKPSNLKQRIVQVFGRKMETQLAEINETTEVVSVKGFVGKPEIAKKTRGEQYFFVNQRFIKSGYLHKAVVDAFENLLPKQYQPSYFLYLEINPSKIDINIHPTKTEIKFEDEHSIFAVLRSAIKHSLGQYNIAPSLDFNQDPEWAFIPAPKENSKIKIPEIKVDKDFNPFVEKNNPKDIKSIQEVYLNASEFEVEAIPKTLFEEINQSEINVIQWLNKYLITTYEENLIILDQHRVHETVLFEKFKKSLQGNTLSQQLLFPIEISVTQKEKLLFESIEKQLISFGFDLSFKEDCILVNASPIELKQENIPAVFEDFINDLEYRESVDFEDNLAKLLAKNAAIRKGEIMQTEQANYLVQQLLKLKEPKYSPFGKLNFVELNELEIIKKLN